MAEDFTLRSIQYEEGILAEAKDIGEDKQQRFDADFLIMTQTLSQLLKDLIPLFTNKEPARKTSSEKSAVPA